MDEQFEDEARAAAASVCIDLPDACVAGVIDNLALLASHTAVLERFLAEHPDL